MSMTLQYNYAILDENDCCHSVISSSYEIPLNNYILIPHYREGYKDKYYNRVDGLFYYEPEYITVFDPEA